MTEPRAATPADAKAVWDSIAGAGGKPSYRTVAQSMSQSGQFLPVSYQKVGRWQRAGWTAPGEPIDAAAQAKARVDAAVPVLTGDATTRLKDLVGEPPATPKEARRETVGTSSEPPNDAVPAPKGQDESSPGTNGEDEENLDTMPLDQLMKLASREAYVTSVRLMRHIRASLDKVNEQPKEVGSLLQALVGSVSVANTGVEIMLDVTERMMKTIDGRMSDDDMDDDPLDEYLTALDAHIDAE